MGSRTHAHESQVVAARAEGSTAQVKIADGVFTPHPTNHSKQPCFTDLATAAADVSAFCRAVILKVVPRNFWGEGEPGSWNKQAVMRSVDQFISMRRFESLTLHEVVQNLKVGHICILRVKGVLMITDSGYRLATPSQHCYLW